MSHSISTLLKRNLDVFGENDPARRRAVIDEIFIEVACSMTPTTASTAAVTRSIGSRARSRQLTLTSSTSQSPSPKVGRWRANPMVSARPGEAPAYAGTDFIVAREGRIAAVYLFFDKLP